MKRMKPNSKKRQRLCLGLAAAVAAVAIAGPAVHALAGIDLTRSDCQIRITMALSDQEKNPPDVVYDVYRVAAAAEVKGYDTYTFDAEEAFESVQDAIADPDITNEIWKDVRYETAEIALGLTGEEAVSPVKKGVSLDHAADRLPTGLYLVIARGDGLTDAEDYIGHTKSVEGTEDAADQIFYTIAYSDRYEYHFEPMLIALPTKEAMAGENAPNTANTGDWIYDPSAALKYTFEPRLGSLEIVKTLDTYETKDPATFLFSIEALLDDEIVYSDVEGITFTDPGQGRVQITDLPAGAEVTVTEIYSGANYRLTSDNTQSVTITADETAEADFSNTYDDTYRGGGAIINHFEYDDEDGWEWTRTE